MINALVSAYVSDQSHFGFEMLTSVKMSIMVVTLCGPEDGDSIFFRNVGTYLGFQIVSQPRITTWVRFVRSIC